MMQFFRNAAKPIILVTTIAFFVWLVYDLSGLGTGSGLLTTTSVGKVNGVSVDSRAFQAAVQQATDQRQRQGGTALTLEETARIRDQVWEQYIQDIIFRAEYRKHGITASAQEIADAIRSSPIPDILENPDFHTNGQFDSSKYNRWLSSTAGQSAIPYLESEYRNQIMRGKLLRTIITDVTVSDAALWERYQDEKEQVKVGALIIDPAVAVADAAAPVTPKEVEDYYEAHRDDFKRLQAAYLSYLMVPREPNASDTAAALARARTIREEIRAGAPFAEVARRESSDTVTGRQGGELGEMSRTQVDAAFGAAAMSLPLNTLSEPVISGFGVHLIEVESRKGESFKARHILVPIEVTGDHRTSLDLRADSLEQLAAERLEPSALDTAASALKLPVLKAGPIAPRASFVTPGAGTVPDVSVWAFQAQPGEESPVIEAEKAYLVFRLDSAQSEGVPPLAAVKDAVEAAVRLARKQEAAGELGRRIAADAKKSGASLRTFATGNGISWQELGPFSRLSSPFNQPELVGAAFGAANGAVSGPVAVPQGVYLFEQISRTAADTADFSKNLSQLRAEALQAARSNRVRAYVMALRASAKIVDRRADVYKTNAQIAAAQPATPAQP